MGNSHIKYFILMNMTIKVKTNMMMLIGMNKFTFLVIDCLVT